MKFQSTRDKNEIKYTSAQVIKQGLAYDGGLFVPDSIPTLTQDEIRTYTSLSYPELAANVLSKFLTDYTYEELLADASAAYSKESFSPDPCPLAEVDKRTYSLELWHGPTCAFKDMALQIMPRLLSRALTKTGETREALVLVATSGDTGKAALEGYKDIDRIKISVFYPENGVSTVQKLQMTTQTGNNVNVCAVKGNFDDIQTGVKHIFSDDKIATELNEKGVFLSSANSINFGRLAPQIVYYIKAYCDLLNAQKIRLGDSINVCVPTGNFGNILAAYIAKLMGLPINKLICASNSNNVLTDFFNTGRYDRNRPFHLTSSPSMDILISSNLERLLYFIAGSEKTLEWMESLNTNGNYQIDSATKEIIDDNFVGFFADEYDTATAIKNNLEKNQYLMDTHTAVAFSALESYRKASGDNTLCVVASTASPFKFAKDVYESIWGNSNGGSLMALDMLANNSGAQIPDPLKDLDKRPVNFRSVVDPQAMYGEVLNFIKK